MYTRNLDVLKSHSNAASGTSISFVSGTSNKETTTKTRVLVGQRTGTRVSHYKDLIKEGRNAASDYLLDVQRAKSLNGFQLLQYDKPGNFYSPFRESNVGIVASHLVPFNHLGVNTAGADNEALSRIYTRIRTERSHMNGMNFLGELRETIQLIRKPAAALTKKVNQLLTTLHKKKQRLGQVPPSRRSDEWSKVFSGSLLEANFGWSPLISDIRAIAETAARIAVEPPKRTRITATAETSSSVIYPANPYKCMNTVLGWWGTVNGSGRLSTKYTCKITVGLNWPQECALSATKGLATVFGFTAENLIPTLYELTPFSFLADYFSNLGSVIEGATTDTSNVLWSTRVKKTQSLLEWLEVPVDPGPTLAATGCINVSVTGMPGSFSQFRTTLAREANYPLGVPAFSLASPGENVRQLSNMVALLNEFRHPAGFRPSTLRL
jgi:hypothetical protein